MAIARRASVTVSIAADSKGMFRLILRVRRVLRDVSAGRTFEYAGTSSKSSNVSAFWSRRIAFPIGEKADYTEKAVFCLKLLRAAGRPPAGGNGVYFPFNLPSGTCCKKASTSTKIFTAPETTVVLARMGLGR